MPFERDALSCKCPLCKVEFSDSGEKTELPFSYRDGEVNLGDLCWYNLYPSIPRLNFLRQIRDRTPTDAIIVEIGSHVGFVSNLFAADNRKVFCVDVWGDELYNSEDGGAGGIVSHNSHLGGWTRVFDRFCLNAGTKLYKQIFALRMPSREAARRFPFGVDLVYVDGAHDEENVETDIVSWWEKLKSGGIMIGDDFGSKGVKMAVNKIFGEVPEIAGQWAVTKT